MHQAMSSRKFLALLLGLLTHLRQHLDILPALKPLRPLDSIHVQVVLENSRMFESREIQDVSLAVDLYRRISTLSTTVSDLIL